MLGDGTFKSAPKPFVKIFTLFGVTGDWKTPVVWALLGGKTEEIYDKFFVAQSVKNARKNFKFD